ncbi:MAG: hypothetical protein HZA03_00360 [Nitrospinae bacterium]|nr:hypothetical protein [Nitrospinota bacterium]
MNRMISSIAILGCAALVGNAAMTCAEEMPAGAESNGRILTINFIGQRPSSVTLHYKVSENGAGTKSAMILLESLKRKLAEKGFERRHAEDAWQNAVHGYSVFIIGDAGYSKKARSLEKRDGHLMAIIEENDELAALNGVPAQGSGLDYRQIEKMADEIVARLLFHSYI